MVERRKRRRMERRRKKMALGCFRRRRRWVGEGDDSRGREGGKLSTGKRKMTGGKNWQQHEKD